MHLMYFQYTFWMVEHCYAKLNGSQALPFKMLLFQYCQYIKFNYGLGCVIFDGYDEKPSIKDHEHERRSRNASSYIKADLHNKIPCSQKAFLKTKQNVLNYF